MARDLDHLMRTKGALQWRVRMALAFTALLTGCGGGSSSSAPSSYTIGGTITGLTAPGLVLANGMDTVSPDSGAATFTFASTTASGSSYAVMVKTQPKFQFCQVANASGSVMNAAVTSVAVTCGHAWTWVSGSNATEAHGVYGTRGVAAASNVPGARENSATWTDSAGLLWLFGGYGLDSAGSAGALNDLWNYSPSSGLWTWVSGSNTVDAKGAYGTQGVAAASDTPGARVSSAAWTDSSGDLWLFGGFGIDAAGTNDNLNDLWRYHPGSDLWTWVGGSNTVNAAGVYGTQGTAAAGNVPGARGSIATWIDQAGDLWLFGGHGFDPHGSLAWLNDLWRYSPASGLWTWVSGANSFNAAGTYGTQGVAAAGNVPGARVAPVPWIDTGGDLWLFGGIGFDSPGHVGDLNDLWRFTPGSGQWTWVSGSNSTVAPAIYGTQGVAAAGNVPGGRSYSIGRSDSAGDLWLFGGEGFDPQGGPSELGDLWRYDPGTGLWTWVSGSSHLGAAPVYGALGVSAAENAPGARTSSVAWIDGNGSMWLFGGDVDNGPGSVGSLFNDLWVY